MKANSTIFWTKTGTELSSPLLLNHTVFVAWALNVMCYIFLPSNTLPLYLIIFFQGKNMELYSERDRGRGYKFKWESGALHFRKMARVGFSRKPTLSHVYLESKWVIGPLKCQLLSFFTTWHFCQTTNLNVPWLFVFVCVYRLHARGPRAVLWLHPVCSRAKWAGLRPETSAAPHRHTLQTGPKVSSLYLSVKLISMSLTDVIPS